MRSIGIAFLLGVTLMTGLGLYTVLVEPARLVVRTQNIPLKASAWPYSDMKIAVISDLHIGSPMNGQKRLQRIVEEINQQSPDLILILGDYLISGVIGGTYVEPKVIGEQLAALKAPLGVYSVLGNHDWWVDGPGMIAALQANDIEVLEDSATRIEWKGESIWLVGVADDTTRNPNIDYAFRSVSAGARSIVMTHDPGIYLDFPERRSPELYLAGHTHGGQVFLPWLFKPIIPGRAGPEWAEGLIDFKGASLFVTSGIGTSILPVRFNRPPEIAILHLTAGNLLSIEEPVTIPLASSANPP